MTAKERRDASRCCERSRSFTPLRSMESRSLRPAVATKTVPERIEDVEIIVRASGVPVRIGGDRAFYNPTFDFIQLPTDEAFHSPELRAATLFHELAHASGHASRLNRDLSGGFGSSSYAKEELRALS